VAKAFADLTVQSTWASIMRNDLTDTSRPRQRITFEPVTPAGMSFAFDPISFSYDKETHTIMNVTTTTVRVKGGDVGQIVSEQTDAILWQSSPFSTPVTDPATGKVLTHTSSLALEAADAKVESILTALFADTVAA